MEFLKELWAIVLLVAIPTAGIVGFVVHVVTIRKSALEIERLEYQISKLKQEQHLKDSLIEVANFEQVEKYGFDLPERLFRYKSSGQVEQNYETREEIPTWKRWPVLAALITLGVLTVVAILYFYFIS